MTVNPVSTEYLNKTQMKGLLKLGDIVIPGDKASSGKRGGKAGSGDKARTPGSRDPLPSFSASGCAAGVDRQLAYMYDDDRSAFQVLATACAVLPRVAVTGLVALAGSHKKLPEPVAMLMRMANLGIKGVIHSLYYSNLAARVGGELDQSPVADPKAELPNIHQIIGYETSIDQQAYEAALAAAKATDAANTTANAPANSAANTTAAKNLEDK